MTNNEPKTIRELYFYIQGEFKTIREDLQNTRRIVFWIGGIAGSIATGVILGLFKILGATGLFK